MWKKKWRKWSKIETRWKEIYKKKEEDDGRFRGWVWNGEIVVLGEIRNSSVRGAESHG